MSTKLNRHMVVRPWGRDCLPAPFAIAPSGERIGEVWFDPPRELPELLVKYIYTSEALSVQVHPSDDHLPGHGKDECWLVIDAEPGARLGIGFREAINAADMRAAAIDGSIAELLMWHDVRVGDFFQIPAGTVHAIGAGISLIEVQQNSDTTYRLFDHGRDRDLHLDQAVAVADGGPYPARLHCHAGQGSATLLEGPKFRLDRIEGEPDVLAKARYAGSALLVVPLDGAVQMGGEEIVPGDCGLATNIAEIVISGSALIAQPVHH